MTPSLGPAIKAAAALFLYAGFACSPAHALILDFSGNPSGPAGQPIRAGDYSLQVGNGGDASFQIDDAVTLVPGRSAVGLMALRNSDGDRLFFLHSLDVAIKWIGDPALQPDNFGDLSFFFTGVDVASSETHHIDGWDTYTHVVLNVPMALRLAGFESPDDSLAMIRFDNFNVEDGGLAPPPLPIPEPSTYAMMMAGLGFIGFVALRKKRPAGNQQAMPA